MKLDQFLTENKLTLAVFAATIGMSPSTISRIRREHTLPDWRTLELIKRATNGAVTPNDFLPAAPPSAQADYAPSSQEAAE